ncbi:XRE family transcriptional regulator [Streptomyces olindensis]|nr:XRE family transcriptional regulator [Streptomyces olindensis]
MEHNSDLGDFLRSHRDRLTPDAAGLPSGPGARRVPGLRREEVALLAGVSPDYYTRLEQGRHPHVSEAVLTAVARALRLNDGERDYLFALTRPRPTAPQSRRSPRAERTRPEVHRMLDVVGGVTPALVVNHRKDVIASNRLARALIADFDVLPHRERNFARYLLLDPAARDRYENWDEVAETAVAALRLSAGRHRDDRQLNELVGELLLKVPEFRTWWDSHRVVQCAYGVHQFRHPIVGSLALHYEILTFQADPDQGLILYTAEEGSSSAEALALLASWSAPSAPTPTSTRTDRQR